MVTSGDGTTTQVQVMIPHTSSWLAMMLVHPGGVNWGQLEIKVELRDTLLPGMYVPAI